MSTPLPINGTIQNPAQAPVDLNNNDLAGVQNLYAETGFFTNATYIRQALINASAGNDAVIQLYTNSDPFPTDNEKGFISFNKTTGFSFVNISSDSTFTLGAGVGGATGGSILQIAGLSGLGRVYDTVYNTIPTQSYASFSSGVVQAIGSTAASQVITYDTTDIASSDITRGGTGNEGRIICAKAGKYKVLTSVQFTKSSSSAATAYVWFAVNGTPVANSSSAITLAGNSANALATVEVILTLTAGQYIEVFMAGDSTNIQAEFIAAQSSPYVRPANPSVITTVVGLSA